MNFEIIQIKNLACFLAALENALVLIFEPHPVMLVVYFWLSAQGVLPTMVSARNGGQTSCIQTYPKFLSYLFRSRELFLVG